MSTMEKLQVTLRRERRLKLIAVSLIILSLIVIILAVPNMLISFVLAFVMNYLITPIVDILERSRIPREYAILIPFFAAAGLIVFGIVQVLPLVSDQLALLEKQLPQYQVDFVTLIGRTESRFKTFFNLYNIHASEELNSWLMKKTADFSKAIPAVLSASLTVSILAPLFAFFMLQDGRQTVRSILQIVPNDYFEMALNLQHRINDQMGGFVRARFIEAAIVGMVVWVGLALMGFPYAALLGIFAAVTNLIPYIGPIIGAVPAVIIALISEQARVVDPMSLNLFIVTSIYLLAQLIDIIFIIPFLVARIVNLHPVTVIVVIIIGAEVMGILGMVISIPVASVLKLTLSTFYDHLSQTRH
jgi:putative permease